MMDGRTRRVALAAAFVVLGSRYGLGQVAPAVGFEVVSLRQSPPGTMSNLTPPEGSRVHEAGISLTILIQLAFGVERDQVRGPEWLDSQMYDLNATTQGGVSLTRQQMMPLLQQMLTERLKLTWHHETKDVPGYGLLVAKGGAKLEASTGATEGSGNYILSNEIRLQSASMLSFAAALRIPLHQPVIDKTGLTGEFHINLSYAPEGSEDSTLPSIFKAIEEQLGLKLQAQRVPVEVVVVDHVERQPTEN
ncbi:TIGR03435 family protein [Granulicella tundricola]|nr:TIGR03435 family protein [Granulicella tundricola]